MGRTVPSFRIAAEIERTKWKQFRSLLDKKDRKMFDQMFDIVKLYNTACMMAVKPVIVHAVLMSIIFHHYKQLRNMVDDLKNKDDKLASNVTFTLDRWTDNTDKTSLVQRSDNKSSPEGAYDCDLNLLSFSIGCNEIKK